MRLIDTELEITIEASSRELTVFTVKIHPGRAKVHDVMEQIEKKLKVPIRDQKLYHGRTRISDVPSGGLPDDLICSPKPTVSVVVPEYIHLTVEDQNGDSHDIKINKEKSLTALMEELPSHNCLQKYEEAMFFFNGKELSPSKEKGTLTSLGICSGSKLELIKVKIALIEIKVFFEVWDIPVSVRCSPQETFMDLIVKVGMAKCRKREHAQEKVQFVMEERVFDPEQERGPLQGIAVISRKLFN